MATYKEILEWSESKDGQITSLFFRKYNKHALIIEGCIFDSPTLDSNFNSWDKRFIFEFLNANNLTYIDIFAGGSNKDVKSYAEKAHQLKMKGKVLYLIDGDFKISNNYEISKTLNLLSLNCYSIENYFTTIEVVKNTLKRFLKYCSIKEQKLTNESINLLYYKCNYSLITKIYFFYKFHRSEFNRLFWMFPTNKKLKLSKKDFKNYKGFDLKNDCEENIKNIIKFIFEIEFNHSDWIKIKKYFEREEMKKFDSLLLQRGKFLFNIILNILIRSCPLKTTKKEQREGILPRNMAPAELLKQLTLNDCWIKEAVEFHKKDKLLTQILLFFKN